MCLLPRITGKDMIKCFLHSKYELGIEKHEVSTTTKDKIQIYTKAWDPAIYS